MGGCWCSRLKVDVSVDPEEEVHSFESGKTTGGLRAESVEAARSLTSCGVCWTVWSPISGRWYEFGALVCGGCEAGRLRQRADYPSGFSLRCEVRGSLPINVREWLGPRGHGRYPWHEYACRESVAEAIVGHLWRGEGRKPRAVSSIGTQPGNDRESCCSM